MSNNTVPDTHETMCVVLDPTMSRWRRRYFVQPLSGPGRRSFTARRAARGRLVPDSRTSLRGRWHAARERETVRRAGKAWF